MRIGEVLAGRFVSERPAGSGGMGSVFLATDSDGGGVVAVKVMDDAGDVERFRREARVLSEMSHPAIVRYVTHGRSETGEHFLVMEWLEGGGFPSPLAKGARTGAGQRTG